MPGQHLPPDFSQGDPNTIGGYTRAHARPAAFEGPDGFSYSVEIATEPTGDSAQPFAAYLLFLKWRRIGPQGVEGHVESDFLEFGETAALAEAALGTWALSEVHRVLHQCVRAQFQAHNQRKWWDVMRESE